MTKLKTGVRVKVALGGEDVEEEKKTRTSFYLSKNSLEKFKELCKKRGQTPSYVIDCCIKDILDQFTNDAE